MKGQKKQKPRWQKIQESRDRRHAKLKKDNGRFRKWLTEPLNRA